MKCTRLGFLKGLFAAPVGIGLACEAVKAAAPSVKIVEIKRFSGAKAPPTPDLAEFNEMMKRAAEAFDPFVAREFINKPRFWAEVDNPHPLRFKIKA